MNDIILIIYPVLLCVILFRGAVISRKGETAPGFLRPDQTGMVRAAACICVIFHHLTQLVTQYGTVPKGPITVFNDAGFLFTGLFFFFSGYGLITSLRTKENYLETFPLKRFPSVLIPFWVVNLIALLVARFAYGLRGNAVSFLRRLFGFTLVNGNGWFIIEIAFLYLFFWLLFRWIRNSDISLALLCAATVLMMAFAFTRGHDPYGLAVSWFRGEWWYNSTAVFIFGLLYARFRERAEALYAKHYRVLLIINTVLFVCLFRLAVWTVNRFGYYLTGFSAAKGAALTLLVQTAAALAFASLVLLLMMKITLHSRVMTFVGGFSLELFLVHGFFITDIFEGVRMSAFLRYGVVLVCSIAAAALIAPVDKRIIGLVSGLARQLTWRKPDNHTLESEMAKRKKEARIRVLRRVLIAAVLAALLLVWFTTARRKLFAESEYEKEREAIRIAEIGDEVLFGYFETNPNRLGLERLPWIVLKREGSRVCLITKNGIAGSSYHRKHEEVSWEDSDLRAALNSEEYIGIFSRYELESVVNVDGDLITLLTAKEAQELFQSDEERELAITSAAELQGTNINRLSKDNYWDMKGYRSSWWWLRGEPGQKMITAPLVTVDGSISFDLKTVNNPQGAVRPVIYVDAG